MADGRLLRQLKIAGLVTSRRQARMVMYRLTDRGRSQVQRLTDIDRQYHADMSRRLNGDDLDHVTRALWQLVGDRPAGRALQKRR